MPLVPARQRAAAAIVADPEKSDRAIAAEHGMSDRTVNRARKAGATHDAPEMRRGKDGKSYPVSRKLPKRSAPTEVPRDGFNHPVDTAWLVDKLRFVVSHVRHLPKQSVETALNRIIKEIRKWPSE
jgi:hypothetical protein